MIRCIAIDDEPLALKQIISYINKIPYLELIQSFPSAVSALEYIHQNEIDLMFVDINMPDLSGMDFVKSLNNPPKVIFTTAYRDYAVEGFRVDAADYLVKPISFAVFSKAVEKTRQRFFELSKERESIKHDDNFIFLKSEYKIVRVNINNIKYIESMRDYIRIHLMNEDPIMTLLSMKNIMEHLPENDFMRIHRSYIVNLTKVNTIERNRIIFDKDTYLPVSDQYKDDFQNFVNENFLK